MQNAFSRVRWLLAPRTFLPGYVGTHSVSTSSLMCNSSPCELPWLAPTCVSQQKLASVARYRNPHLFARASLTSIVCWDKHTSLPVLRQVAQKDDPNRHSKCVTRMQKCTFLSSAMEMIVSCRSFRRCSSLMGGRPALLPAKE